MMFKMQALLSAVWGVGLILLALSGAGVVSARHKWHAGPTLYVFGDSFVDNGNMRRASFVDEMSRQWHYPYGLSYVNNDESGAQPDPTPTGRFSDFMVQPDFIAQMMGLPKSPPAYFGTQGQFCDTSGMNFGFGPSGVNHITIFMNVREQVDTFKGMIKSGVISKDHVTNSVALIAISGNDYKTFGLHRSSADLTAFTINMTTEIAVNVARLQNLGVKKVLVSNLHPLGCTPTETKPNNYDACDKVRNLKTKLHNANLQHNLGSKKGVLILDMYTAFESIIGDDSSDGRFKKTREPCCVNDYPKGYCGQLDSFAQPMYTVCNDPSEHFFWDDMHPTHAGWEAVTAKLEGHIKKFLGVA
ncbi:unnamed protein product [Alopecurus aequalis]